MKGVSAERLCCGQRPCPQRCRWSCLGTWRPRGCSDGRPLWLWRNQWPNDGGNTALRRQRFEQLELNTQRSFPARDPGPVAGHHERLNWCSMPLWHAATVLHAPRCERWTCLDLGWGLATLATPSLECAHEAGCQSAGIVGSAREGPSGLRLLAKQTQEHIPRGSRRLPQRHRDRLDSTGVRGPLWLHGIWQRQALPGDIPANQRCEPKASAGGPRWCAVSWPDGFPLVNSDAEHFESGVPERQERQ